MGSHCPKCGSLLTCVYHDPYFATEWTRYELSCKYCGYNHTGLTRVSRVPGAIRAGQEGAAGHPVLPDMSPNVAADSEPQVLGKDKIIR